jgi:CO/xanthine dehydrogenase FAD-binding subunit
VDLQDLGLSDLEEAGGKVTVGAACTLQQIVEAEGILSAELAQACRREASWNLRNMATIAGAVLACDGRSPLVCALLAVGAKALLVPGEEALALDDLLDRRRTPADRPIVAAAVGRPDGSAYRVVLAGYGLRPIRVHQAEKALGAGDSAGAGKAAAAVYANAGDALASAAYRSHVAGVLVRRLGAEGLG